MKRAVNPRRRALLGVALGSTMLAPFAHAARGELERLDGEHAPKLALKGPDGGAHDLGAHRGKVVLVNFWATWCEPCRHEMPSIQRLRDKLAGKAFAVLMVNVDEPDARVRRFLAETKLDLPVAMDQSKAVTRAWSVRVLPTTFLVGPDGRLRYRLVGDIDWSADEVVRTVTELLPRK
ncbi:MAG TPA: TlpA disulfide reductase family protein [Burkholderiales bacterium]|nr:TlpA disulfide reductase family protein [Burkholderiales bacterium]